MFDDVLFGWDDKRRRTLSNAYLTGAAFANGSSSFEVLHNANFKDMISEVDTFSEAGPDLCSIADLKEAYAAGFLDHAFNELDDSRLKYLMREIDQTAIKRMLSISASLRMLAMFGLQSSEIVEGVFKQLLAMRQAAVLKLVRDQGGFRAAITRRWRTRKAQYLWDRFLDEITPEEFSHALAMAALDFIRKSKTMSPDEAADWMTAADFLRTASINLAFNQRKDTLEALDKIEWEADEFNEKHAAS